MAILSAVLEAGKRRAGSDKVMVQPRTIINADEASSWDGFSSKY